jgi:hypothetical protein
MPLKSNELSNMDMLKILKSQNININGVFMKDELPKLKEGFYIVNLASEKEHNGGTHWLVFYYTPERSYYFDAYGELAPLEIHNRIKPYVYNKKQIQDYDSTACGYYCLAFIMYMNEFKNKLDAFIKFIKLFSNDTKENDKILYNLLYN